VFENGGMGISNRLLRLRRDGWKEGDEICFHFVLIFNLNFLKNIYIFGCFLLFEFFLFFF
jgi:hypothetical protein